MVFIPFDLFQHILSDWLEADIKVISNLDIAFSTHRQDFLLMLTLLTNHSNLEGVQDHAEYLKWIYARKMPLCTLWLALADVPDLVNELAGMSFPTIQKVHLQASQRCELDTASWASFLSHFPGLTLFTSWATMEDAHVLAFQAQRYALVHLELTDCTKVTRPVLLELIASNCLTLEVLRSWYLDDGCLTELTKCQFPKLKDTTIDCSLIRDPSSLVKLCTLLVSVQRLHLECHPNRDQLLTRQLADQITKACPLLTEFTFRCSDAEAPYCLQPIFANCPRLQVLGIGKFAYMFCCPKTKVWKVMLDGASPDTNLAFVAEAFGAIDRFGMIGGAGRLSEDIIQKFQKKYGDDIMVTQTDSFFIIDTAGAGGFRDEFVDHGDHE